MLLFRCPHCDNRLYFENSKCARCGSIVGYELGANRFELIGQPWMFCANAEHGACNWVVPIDGHSPFCRSCRLNEVIPPIADPVQQRRWADVEAAKRRLVYGLWRLALPVVPRAESPDGLAFRILVDREHGGAGDVTMGHENGVITIDASEADSWERESRRVELLEPFRTLLGHMRHESGHYYWDRLVAPTEWLQKYRALFGDESADYGEALKKYYDDGAPADWQMTHISAYATMHPWEDWAETWAHYLHMVDAVETAAASGFWRQLRADGTVEGSMPDADFDFVYQRWENVQLAMNSMNRSLGHLDFYPFVVSQPARDKLRFVHDLVTEWRERTLREEAANAVSH